MEYESSFDLSQSGFKIVCKATKVDQGHFDAKLVAIKNGKEVAVDFLFNVGDDKGSIKKSLLSKIEETGAAEELVKFAETLLVNN